MVSLSVIIITYNEELNIARCLDSVKSVADEIIVVDSFSTDKTREICESYPVKFYENPFEGHIQQKNFAVTKAGFQYILSIDADEALSERLQRSILAVKSKWTADAYTMNRCTNYCGKWIKHGGWYPDRKLRLFKTTAGVWGGVNPHDKFIIEPGVKVLHLKGDILHYSYDSVEDHIKQTNKFTDIAANELFKQKKEVGTAKLLTRSAYKFFKDYILFGGFLDGYYGFLIAKISAGATYLKYHKLRILNKQRES